MLLLLLFFCLFVFFFFFFCFFVFFLFCFFHFYSDLKELLLTFTGENVDGIVQDIKVLPQDDVDTRFVSLIKSFQGLMENANSKEAKLFEITLDATVVFNNGSENCGALDLPISYMNKINDFLKENHRVRKEVQVIEILTEKAAKKHLSASYEISNTNTDFFDKQQKGLSVYLKERDSEAIASMKDGLNNIRDECNEDRPKDFLDEEKERITLVRTLVDILIDNKDEFVLETREIITEDEWQRLSAKFVHFQFVRARMLVAIPMNVSLKKHMKETTRK